ncbi:MAG: hypothetical protein R2715_25090 [Ilumatobacteraceae bacterium]
MRAGHVAGPSERLGDAPDWELIDTGDTVSWHDHRSHWMSPKPPPIVQGDPGTERVVLEDDLSFIEDGEPATAHVVVTWQPPPSQLWLLGVSAANLVALALVTLRRRSAGFVAAIAGVGAFVGRPAPFSCTIATVLAAALGIAALALHLARRERSAIPLGTAAGTVALLVAVVRFDTLSRALVPGSIPATVQRLLILSTMAAGAGALFAGLLAVASPRRSPPDATRYAPTPS